ncbi:MAG: DNA mismatch repair endonuclease MutL [Bacillota bacterium]|nr:DNA mismatch repair endonuclease MutL [Bacillota bacterium]
MAEPLTSKIRILDTLTANQIAAGEVIERPAFVVKELAENAIDAQATRIAVTVYDAECSKIQVSDNGFGMSAEDMRLAVLRHATSKLRRIEDLERLDTLGFRGEALPSIAAVSHLTITSRAKNAEVAYTMHLQEGKGGLPVETAARHGTTVLIDRLFYNAPARRKFLRSPRTEQGLIGDTLTRMAISRPDIAFSLELAKRQVFATSGSGRMQRCVFEIYGKAASANLLPLEYDNGLLISGLVSAPAESRANRNHYCFFVNGRWVRSRELSYAVDEAYAGYLPRGRYPLVFIDMQIAPSQIDVNVHPSKLEIKLRDPAAVKMALINAITAALGGDKRATPQLGRLTPPQHSELGREDEDSSLRLRQKQRYKQTGLPLLEKGADISGRGLYRALYGDNGAEQAADTALSPQLSEQAVEAEAEHQQRAAALSGEQRPRYGELQLLGQAGGMYIVAAAADSLYIIDQHAAAERVLYEKILARIDSGADASALLATPLPLSLSPSEFLLLGDMALALRELGFIIELFGESSYILRGVPAWYEGSDGDALLLGMLAQAAKGGANIKKLRREELCMAACKQAIKANRHLTDADMRQLLNDLDGCANSATCPHGRPLALRISFSEINKHFLRGGI